MVGWYVATQQPPPSHALFAQHGAPAPPHFWHIRIPVVGLLVPHTSPASVHCVPVGQQAWPSFPHF